MCECTIKIVLDGYITVQQRWILDSLACPSDLCIMLHRLVQYPEIFHPIKMYMYMYMYNSTTCMYIQGTLTPVHAATSHSQYRSLSVSTGLQCGLPVEYLVQVR